MFESMFISSIPKEFTKSLFQKKVFLKNFEKIFSAKMVDCNDTAITGFLKAIPKGPVVSTILLKQSWDTVYCRIGTDKIVVLART